MTDVNLEHSDIAISSCNHLELQSLETHSVEHQATIMPTIGYQAISSLPLHSENTSMYDISNVPQATLEIIRQPKGKMRFRYESEKGSHGCLTAENQGSDKKTYYPTVKLSNYHGIEPVFLRASLYTHGVPTKPHVHGFSDTSGESYCKDGVCQVKFDKNMMAVLPKLNITFRPRKRAKEILYERQLQSFGEQVETWTAEQHAQLREKCCVEAKNMDLNCVIIGFEAIVVPKDSTRHCVDICPMVFSNPIIHPKSDLKIVRISKVSGSVEGNEEVFVFVEKVDKKNIQIKFVQYDNNDGVIWEGNGDFNESDVHHQYAIVFKTPSYKERNIDQEVDVSIFLYRPSNGDRSEAIQFSYIPVNKHGGYEDFGRKRRKVNSCPESFDSAQPCTSYSSSSEASPCSYNFSDTGNEFAQVMIQFEKNGDIDAFLKACSSDFADLINDQDGLLSHSKNPYLSSTMETDSIAYVDDTAVPSRSTFDDLECHSAVVDLAEEFENKLYLEPSKEEKLLRCLQMLQLIIQKLQADCNSSNGNGNNILHLAVLFCGSNTSLMFILMYALRSTIKNLINQKNDFEQTPVVLAVENDLARTLNLLLKFGGSHRFVTSNGNSLLHVATKNKCVDCLRFLLQNEAYNDIDAVNHGGYTSLHYAVMFREEECVRLLCSHKCDVNKVTRGSGETALHLACKHYPSVIAYLINSTNIDVEREDYAGRTSYDIATLLHLPEAELLQKKMYYDCKDAVSPPNVKVCSTEKQGYTCLDSDTKKQIILMMNEDKEKLHSLGMFLGLDHVDVIIQCERPAEKILNEFLKKGDVKLLPNAAKLAELTELSDLLKKIYPEDKP